MKKQKSNRLMKLIGKIIGYLLIGALLLGSIGLFILAFKWIISLF